jgi:hypothetical protein
MTLPTLSEARAPRPSQVIAEALVDRQAPNQIEARARELGYSNCLTDAVVRACCGGKKNDFSSRSQPKPVPVLHNSNRHAAS